MAPLWSARFLPNCWTSCTAVAGNHSPTRSGIAPDLITCPRLGTLPGISAEGSRVESRARNLSGTNGVMDVPAACGIIFISCIPSLQVPYGSSTWPFCGSSRTILAEASGRFRAGLQRRQQQGSLAGRRLRHNFGVNPAKAALLLPALQTGANLPEASASIVLLDPQNGQVLVA